MQNNYKILNTIAVLAVLCLFALNSVVAQQLLINEVMSSNATTITDADGDYPDWIELYNAGPDSFSLLGYGLSDDLDDRLKWVFPDVLLPPEGFLLIFASGKNRRAVPGELHTNFRIRADGEDVILTMPNRTLVDHLEPVAMDADISYGRTPDGGREWVFFDDPTPGVSNDEEHPHRRAPPPLFTQQSGFYPANFRLAITCPDSSAVIRYTLDGGIPSDSSAIYNNPIRLDTVTVIRAVSFKDNMFPSHPVNGSYIIDYQTNLPVVSIITNPVNLWDMETGIYVEGPNANPEPPHHGANYWQDWEIPIHIDFIGEDGYLGFSQSLGAQIYGGWTRMFPQKSLRIIARNEYGHNRIEYRLFDNIPIHSFKSIILRNAGNDWDKAMIRDPLMTGLIYNTGIGYQAYRPCVVFLNGVYWGIHNLRERLDEFFLASHYGVDRDNIDIIENHRNAEEGDIQAYQVLIGFIENNDMSRADAYDSVQTMMSIEDYIRYMAAEIYIANVDWPAHNIRCWRSRSEGGRFRWLMYDTDHGFGASGRYYHNTLEYASAPEQPHPPWATVLFRMLLENDEFIENFVVRLCDLMNFQFQQERVLTRIAEYQNGIADEMPRHTARWYPDHNWETHLARMRTFACNRKNYVIRHLLRKFNLGQTYLLAVEQAEEVRGRVKVNAFYINNFPWEGDYFEDYPVTVVAEPFAGYRFVCWAGDIDSFSDSLELELTGDLTINACFEPVNGIEGGVVITEINYHSPDEFDPGDWVELYALNGSHNLRRWLLCDDNNENEFVIPGIQLNEGERLIIAENRNAFINLFPDVYNVIGDMGFNLGNGGDQVRLYDSMARLVDSVAYEDSCPWPFQPDGDGPTLQLINPAYLNEYAHNWGPSLSQYGNPGDVNQPFGIKSKENQLALPVECNFTALYPNPFNGQLHIEFGLNVARWVKIIAYDVSGREVVTLASDYFTPGFHRLDWDAANLSSGVYFLRLVSADKTQIRKALLIR